MALPGCHKGYRAGCLTYRWAGAFSYRPMLTVVATVPASGGGVCRLDARPVLIGMFEQVAGQLKTKSKISCSLTRRDQTVRPGQP